MRFSSQQKAQSQQAYHCHKIINQQLFITANFVFNLVRRYVFNPQQAINQLLIININQYNFC